MIKFRQIYIYLRGQRQSIEQISSYLDTLFSGAGRTGVILRATDIENVE